LVITGNRCGVEKMVKENNMDTNGLEDKVNLLGRLKYVAAPLVLAAGAYFTPELKAKYGSLPMGVRDKYKIAALTGAVLIGSVMTASSGYKLYKKHQERKEAKASYTRMD